MLNQDLDDLPVHVVDDSRLNWSEIIGLQSPWLHAAYNLPKGLTVALSVHRVWSDAYAEIRQRGRITIEKFDRAVWKFFIKILLHETAHAIAESGRITDTNSPPVAAYAAVASHLSEINSGQVLPPSGAGAIIPFDGHDARFVRAAIHLHYRAAKLGAETPLDGILHAANYELSSLTAYAEALGTEPALLADEPFRRSGERRCPLSF